MIGVYSILLGAAMVLGALFLLKKEFKQAYFIGPKLSSDKFSSGQEDLLLDSINQIEQGFMEMSEAFYDISGDLEGKYSVHEKELSLLEDRIVTLETVIRDQGKEINTLNKKIDKLELVESSIQPSIQTENPSVSEAEFDLEKRIEGVEDDGVDEKPNVVVEPEPSDIKGQIIALRSKGYSLKQIAKALDIGLGEIQLILNMKRP